MLLLARAMIVETALLQDCSLKEGFQEQVLSSEPELLETASAPPSLKVIDIWEKRVAKNGNAYTCQEFVDFFGPEDWKSFWHNSSIVDRFDAEGNCSQCSSVSRGREGTNEFADKFYCKDCWDSFALAVSPAIAATLEQRYANDGHPYACQKFVDFFGPEAWRWHWENSFSDPSNTKSFCSQCGSVSPCTVGKGDFQDITYCDDCWVSWSTFVTSVPRVVPESNSLEEAVRIDASLHYDFIEVGTSDWGTITQHCAGDVTKGSGSGSDIRTSLEDLQQVRGIAIDVVGEYLAALPCLPRVIKVAAAMGEFSGMSADVFYVSLDNISKHMGEFTAALHGYVDVMWYAKSMSSVGKPHPQLEWLLRDIGRLDLLEMRKTKVLNWSTLCSCYGVDTVDVVQLDCEGMDCSIIRGLLAHCATHPKAYPRVINFEANHLTPPDEIENTVAALSLCGYQVHSRTSENIRVERG